MSPARETGGALPNASPRPPEELETLERVWAPPKGWRLLSAVNNTYIGLFYIGTSLVFFVLAGVLALLMRTQLAVPDNDLLDAATYNQVFTMHGTVMMFLFALPVIEAMAVYVLPGMLAARDLPFPRLSAYAFWAYAIGGSAFFCSLFFGLAPDGGWFIYTPLTSYKFSPGDNIDFWLLGIGFIEISAIAGAIELVVGVLRTRAPGMSLDKMPIYAWAMLVVGGMIIFGLPPVIAGSALLELERAFHWPFFIAEKGGDPLLWQHLFWLFGHPEVYIIFLPAAGMVSMIVPTIARTPLVAYRLVVVALVGTGFLSFGLWVHHMFATGIPALSLSFFSAASMAVAIPSGIQVFAWLATLFRGERPTITTPALFIFGFLFIFTLGGLTGVMVAAIPFDWQAHDSYFIVAHLHYVLIGGMVFPLFAAFYYWAPTVSGRRLSERLGRWVFGLMFVGFNVAFFPMHFTGLLGMPRRVYTYPGGLGWDWLNMVSTLGAFVLAAGVLVFLIDLALHFRIAGKVEVNPWGAGTLEWLPLDNYAARSIPLVRSREPLWDNPRLAEEVSRGEHFLPGAQTGGRETIITSAVDATPQYVLQMPGPSWRTVLGALFTAGFFLLLTVKLVWPALICGVIALGAILAWVWQTDHGPTHPPIDIGGGITLPVYAAGRDSHSWWAVVTFLCADGAIYASVLFAYLFLWTVNPGDWPPPDAPRASTVLIAAAAALLAGSLAAVVAAGRALAADRTLATRLAMPCAVVLLVGGFVLALGAWIESGLRPEAHSYGAAVYLVLGYVGVHVATLLVMGLYTFARDAAGLLNSARRATFDNTALMWRYGVVTGLLSLALLQLFPLAAS